MAGLIVLLFTNSIILRMEDNETNDNDDEIMMMMLKLDLRYPSSVTFIIIITNS